ncbi:hypothetical protein [Mycobacterium sp. M26]|uniref:O-antigen ligase family protein n=1 Tax=Mycobacterium sp. M26 TaxID=1762962 RepID=UPI000A654B83|nr:hypothetical protein [Mycobacterium sp. M26]
MPNQPGRSFVRPSRPGAALAVAPLAIVLLAFPAIASFSPERSNTILVAVCALLLPLIVGRLEPMAWPSLWLLAFVVLYALSSASEEDAAQGIRHTITLGCTGVVFLTFAAWGSELFDIAWFVPAAAVAIAVDVVGVYQAGLPKNTTAGALVYLCALALVILIRNSQTNGWWAAAAFSVAGLILSVALSMRFLVACAVLFLVMFFLANRLSAKWYFRSGVIVSAITIPLVVWFFLNISRGGIAQQIGYKIAEITGRHATTGRDVLYPYLLYVAQKSPVFGLGAGTRPRDVVSTSLSAHDYYIQVFMQVGVVGLVLLVCFLLATWRVLVQARSAVGRFGSALFIMLILHNSTEVFMFQNSSLVVVPAWCAIGLAFSFDRRRSLDG